MSNDDSKQFPHSFGAVLKLFSDKTATSMSSSGVIADHSAAFFLNRSGSNRERFETIGYTIIEILPVSVSEYDVYITRLL